MVYYPDFHTKIEILNKFMKDNNIEELSHKDVEPGEK